MAKRERTTLWKRLKNPPNWIAISSFVASFVLFPLAIVTSILDSWLNFFAILACALCVVPFLYTIFIIVVFCVRTTRKLARAADKHAFTRQLFKSFEFRTMFFAVCTFISNVGYTVFLAVVALLWRSLWFAALAAYYILLTSARGGVLLQNYRDGQRFKEDELALQRAKAGTYRYCGIMMIALTLAMAISVVRTMIVGVGESELPVWTVYLFAGYALYRVVMSVINFVRASSRDDLAVRAVKYINLAAAMVSVFTLQTAIFHAFFSGFNPVIYNAISGFAVCLTMLILGVYIISFSSIVRQKTKRELKERGAFYKWFGKRGQTDVQDTEAETQDSGAFVSETKTQDGGEFATEIERI